eukprot:GFYU01005622.1.p1 GENE.GFYU01005622.1~~GFYU01005622.1.p1  ORF type:complete len:252 (+),score=87.25 GFYU01005622.1:1-756(+)
MPVLSPAWGQLVKFDELKGSAAIPAFVETLQKEWEQKHPPKNGSASPSSVGSPRLRSPHEPLLDGDNALIAPPTPGAGVVTIDILSPRRGAAGGGGGGGRTGSDVDSDELEDFVSKKEEKDVVRGVKDALGKKKVFEIMQTVGVTDPRQTLNELIFAYGDYVSSLLDETAEAYETFQVSTSHRAFSLIHLNVETATGMADYKKILSLHNEIIDLRKHLHVSYNPGQVYSDSGSSSSYSSGSTSDSYTSESD